MMWWRHEPTLLPHSSAANAIDRPSGDHVGFSAHCRYWPLKICL